jgi:hypothetical protein
MYEYKVSLRKDGKEHRQLELVQNHTKIGKFHCLYYWPTLGRGRYHSTSYMLAACCWRERRTVPRSSIGSHCNYGERMPLSFNEEIQSGYYQNMSVSVKGASIEWVDAGGALATLATGQTTPSRTLPRQRIICIASCALADARHSLSTN